MAVRRSNLNQKNIRKKKNSFWLPLIVLVCIVAAGSAYFAYNSGGDGDDMMLGNGSNTSGKNSEKNYNVTKNNADLQAQDDKMAQDDKNTNKKENKTADNSSVPPARIYGAGKGKLAIIIDDFGYNGDVIDKFANIDRPLTFAVLPNKQFSKDAVRKGLSSNHAVILHLPMETVDGTSSEDGSIMVSLGDDDIKARVKRMMDGLPGITGVNNHQGSKATADKRVMRDVLQVIKEKGVFFIDSRTNADSVAEGMAEKLGVPTGANALFLDNNADVASVKKQIREAMHISAQKGDIIVIGHARANTAEAIKEMLPELDKNGIVLVRASSLTR